jgi:hypothetical protein
MDFIARDRQRNTERGRMREGKVCSRLYGQSKPLDWLAVNLVTAFTHRA